MRMRMRSAWCVAAVMACGVDAAAQVLDRAPYLQLATPTAVTISWRTTTAAAGRVHWGSSPGALAQQELQARVAGLESDISLLRVDLKASQDKARSAAADIEALCAALSELPQLVPTIVDYSYGLIPVIADAIKPDPSMSALIRSIREPHEQFLTMELGVANTLLYRRDTFSGTFDDLICQALLAERDVEIFQCGLRPVREAKQECPVVAGLPKVGGDFDGPVRGRGASACHPGGAAAAPADRCHPGWWSVAKWQAADAAIGSTRQAGWRLCLALQPLHPCAATAAATALPWKDQAARGRQPQPGQRGHGPDHCGP